MSTILLLAAVALPAAGALGAGPRTRLGPTFSGAAFVIAVALLIVVAADGPVSAVIGADDGTALAGLYADRVGAIVLLLITGVSTVVQSFARRYLRGDAQAGRFFAATGVLTSATAAMACAATLIGLAIAWTASGIALCLLLGMYADLPAARDGLRRTARAFAIGDVALWIAVAAATLTWGGIDLRTLGDRVGELKTDGSTLTVVVCLIVVAALARSAQLPFQGWLPATLAAPTPVSALLHAGVVNAGGILLVRLSPLLSASSLASHLAFAAGAATLVYGTTLMLTKPDVKGALAHSTMGQMGFMIMTCGLGAFAAAIFHLVAHGMYKATLFLGSGSAVHRHVRHLKAPPATPAGPVGQRLRWAAALLLPTTALALAVAVVGLPSDRQTGAALLLVFAWSTGVALTAGWMRRHATARGAGVALVATLLAAPAYVALVHGATGFLDPAVAGGTAVAPGLLAIVVLALAGASLIRLLPAHPRLAHLHRAAYVLALSAGHVPDGRRLRLRGVRRRTLGQPALAGGAA